jgi:hypothetical protein
MGLAMRGDGMAQMGLVGWDIYQIKSARPGTLTKERLKFNFRMVIILRVAILKWGWH